MRGRRISINALVGQLVNALNRAERKMANVTGDIPFVLIGHSKIFSSLNERNLRPFLEFVQRNNDRFEFESFAHFKDRDDELDRMDGSFARRASPAIAARVIE